MKEFEYVAPTSLREAVSLMAGNGTRVRPMAGGTDLIVQLAGGRFELDRVVDVKNIPELNALTYDSRRGLTIGAAVPCYKIYENDIVREKYPALVDSATIIGGIQIQSRATFGGNLCNASPSADSVPTLIVLQATANIAGPQGTRGVLVESFCTAPGRSVLQPGELLVSMTIPPPQPHSGAFYLRFIPRNEMDIAIVGAGASVVLSNDSRTIKSARVSLGAVAPTPLLVSEASSTLAGKPANEETIALAADAARRAAKPINDMRGTVEQRKHLSAVLTTRALRGAIARAKGEKVNGH